MLHWLRKQYDSEINDRHLAIDRNQSPSVVAHSFGTYILGYTLLRFDFIKFDKVILCGSILPKDFPWGQLIDRGQVQSVRNEYGVRDPWAKRVQCFVRGTGPSGAEGFTCNHERLVQEQFDYNHSEYFGRDHMEDRWFPFLEQFQEHVPRPQGAGTLILRPAAQTPWCLYGCFLLSILFLLILIFACFSSDPVPVCRYNNDNFIQAIKFMNAEERTNRFPSFWSRYGNCPVEWTGVIVASSSGTYVIKACDNAPEYSHAFFDLKNVNDFTNFAKGTVVKLKGTLKAIGPAGLVVKEAEIISTNLKPQLECD